MIIYKKIIMPFNFMLYWGKIRRRSVIKSLCGYAAAADGVKNGIDKIAAKRQHQRQANADNSL